MPGLYSKQDLREEIGSAIDELFTSIAEKADLSSGDLEPLQKMRLDKAIDEMADVFDEWFRNNYYLSRSVKNG